MTNEIERALALDWWVEQRAQVEEDLRSRVDALLWQAHKAVDNMSTPEAMRIGKFHKNVILPMIIKWVESERDRLSSEIGEAFTDQSDTNPVGLDFSALDYSQVTGGFTLRQLSLSGSRKSYFEKLETSIKLFVLGDEVGLHEKTFIKTIFAELDRILDKTLEETPQ